MVLSVTIVTYYMTNVNLQYINLLCVRYTIAEIVIIAPAVMFADRMTQEKSRNNLVIVELRSYCVYLLPN